MFVPARGTEITITNHAGTQRRGIVTAYNYFFERIDGVYVDYLDGERQVNQLAWLHQLS
jgi:hypothetical protein